MYYTVTSATDEIIRYICLFVAILPFSQYSYIEATKNMKMDKQINCNHQMFKYFGRSTVIMVCDNLMASVMMHTKMRKSSLLILTVILEINT